MTWKEESDKINFGGYVGDPPDEPPILQEKDAGTDVSALQSLLNIPWLPITGFFDDTTDYAVRAFQCSQGLKVDGVVDHATWAALERLATTR